MAIVLEIANLQKRMTLRIPTLRRIIRKILKAEGVTAAHLSLVFVSDRKIHFLNKKFLGHDYPTDVLAFDLRANPSRGRGRILEGEVIISTDAALRQWPAFASSPEAEIVLYLIHGILHLLGYDDHRPRDVRRMRGREAKLLKLVMPTRRAHLKK